MNMTLDAGTWRPASYRHESLSDADLAGADLRTAIFEHVDLSGARLRGARLDGAILRHCDLSGADLSGARLEHASLTLVELRQANLSRCDLRRCTWTSCIAEEADLAAANLDGGALVGCRFDGADFTDASFLRTNTLHSVFSRARFAGAKKFAWSREVVVEILARAVDDVECAKLVGAVAVRQDWCYDAWRSILAGTPRYRHLALQILSAYPESGFAAAMADPD